MVGTSLASDTSHQCRDEVTADTTRRTRVNVYWD